jgi:hypothetical protein
MYLSRYVTAPPWTNFAPFQWFWGAWASKNMFFFKFLGTRYSVVTLTDTCTGSSRQKYRSGKWQVGNWRHAKKIGELTEK